MIPITKPEFGPEELKAVKEVLTSGWVVQGPKVAEFEQLLEKYMGLNYAVATSSCTTALHMAIIAAGIKPGDEVIVPAFTWVATANVVEYVGAKPIFADIDLETFNIDIHQIEKKITRHTRAIIPVHLFGLAANMDPILKIARQYSFARKFSSENYKLKVIEDAACALGTKYKGKHVGALGDIGCFSFHPRKAITTGEGGLYTTNKKDLAMLAKSLRDHGSAVTDLERHKGLAHNFPAYDIVGYNYRMTDIQAAIGVEQVKKIKKILANRIKRAQVYNRAFKNHPYLQVPACPPYSNHTYQSYVLLLKENAPLSRDELAKKLAQKGMATRQGTQNVPMLGYYRKKFGFQSSDFPMSDYAEKNTLTIPLYAAMTQKEQEYVIKNIMRLFK